MKLQIFLAVCKLTCMLLIGLNYTHKLYLQMLIASQVSATLTWSSVYTHKKKLLLPSEYLNHFFNRISRII